MGPLGVRMVGESLRDAADPLVRGYNGVVALVFPPEPPTPRSRYYYPYLFIKPIKPKRLTESDLKDAANKIRGLGVYRTVSLRRAGGISVYQRASFVGGLEPDGSLRLWLRKGVDLSFAKILEPLLGLQPVQGSQKYLKADGT